MQRRFKIAKDQIKYLFMVSLAISQKMIYGYDHEPSREFWASYIKISGCPDYGMLEKCFLVALGYHLYVELDEYQKMLIFVLSYEKDKPKFFQLKKVEPKAPPACKLSVNQYDSKSYETLPPPVLQNYDCLCPFSFHICASKMCR